jgi:serpin B
MERRHALTWCRLALVACVGAGLLVATQSKSNAAEDDDQLADPQAQFGLRLLAALAKEEPSRANLLVSPGSLGAVLAFLDLGADARMHDALAKTLGLAPEGSAMETLREQAKALAAVPLGQGPLAFANAVFVDPEGEIFPAAINRLRAAGTEAEIEALNGPPGEAAINRWVSDQTAGLVPTILDKPLDGAVLVALNALHFKDKWEEPFTAGQTSPESFHLVGGSTKDVPMMRRHPDGLAFRQDDRFIAVALPYETPGFSLIVLTTKDKPAELADFADVADWLSGSGFAETQVFVAMPKFEAAMTAHLLPELDEMGLAEGDSPTAFQGFSAKPLVLSDVVQKTLIRVDETGTEAAAASAATMAAGARPVKDLVTVQVDKPFLFALRDEMHRTILLAGYVGDPTAK